MNPLQIIKTLYLYSKAEGTAWLFVSFVILLIMCIAFMIYNIIKDLF